MSDIDAKISMLMAKIDDMEFSINLRQNFILDRLSRINERLTSNTYKLLILQRRMLDYMPVSMVKTCVDPDECSICYQKKKENKIITVCNHIFHQSCLESWTSIKNNCPYCRTCL